MDELLLLRFELLFWHMARYKCRLLTYLRYSCLCSM